MNGRETRREERRVEEKPCPPSLARIKIINKEETRGIPPFRKGDTSSSNSPISWKKQPMVGEKQVLVEGEGTALHEHQWQQNELIAIVTPIKGRPVRSNKDPMGANGLDELSLYSRRPSVIPPPLEGLLTAILTPKKNNTI